MCQAFLARTVALAFAAMLAVAPRASAQATDSSSSTAAADSVAIVDASQLAVQPGLVNRRDVAHALAQSYAKIGTQLSGRAVLTFIVDERGRTQNVEVAESSGYPEIDRGMVEVAKRMRWSPSVQDGHPVRVRVHLPMTYQREINWYEHPHRTRAMALTVAAVIGRDGRVEGTRVVSATRTDFGDAADQVARMMRFKPGKIGGVPVRVRIELPVTFEVH